jgi:hypothetical protein
MSEWKLVDVEGIGSGYACLTLDGVSTTKSRNLIQADRGAGGDGLGFSDLGTLLIDYADRDIAGVVGISGDQGGIREDVVGRSDVHIISGVEFCSAHLVELYSKPAIVIGIDDEGNATDSARSIDGFNIFEAISSCSDILTHFGGHPLAAGMGLNVKDIAAFRKRINDCKK